MEPLPLDEYLLYNGYQELQERVERFDPYDMIRASSLLRQMFLDGGGIAPAIAKRYNVKLLFSIINFPDFGKCNEDYVFEYVQLAPNPRLNHRLISVDLNQFFRTPCIATQERVITVREIILMVAHVNGGVHLGQPKNKNPEQVDLLAIDKIFSLGGVPTTLHCLLALTKVVLEALSPIIQAIDAAAEAG
ncbi:hypothetical protein Q5H89_10075 [Hymenobacter sp. CA2-7]|nr:hypothetical protein [Hymenobacter sp. CA2-7]